MAPDQMRSRRDMNQTPMDQALTRNSCPMPKDCPKTITHTCPSSGQTTMVGRHPLRAHPHLAHLSSSSMATDAIRTRTRVVLELLGGGKQDANWEGVWNEQEPLAILPGRDSTTTMFMEPLLASTAAAFLTS